ncbi:hypothetical protein KFL_001180340 [Klebsormidium nitens]|uniref:Protein Iojap, chloroplastic n=1 Tax=Klebsormidium nitens TaxID=105231 RepID=A0A1Y1HVL0_KLENI|nr:hypothetical protein KFL_001180340 [Klebsormidium nitens]|eukprot:GAQ82655.1 hypothetical protein KFL_001180340 [Klebsormidium nitens]
MEESELQGLWDKFGEMVVSNPDVMALEDLDDTDSKQFAVAMAEIADLTKAADVQVLHVAPFVYWTRVMVLVTAFSRPQVNAIGSRIREAALEKFQRTPENDVDDGTPKSWTVVDFGDVVIHVFLPKEREYYALDDYYKEAEAIPLPFANRGLE